MSEKPNKNQIKDLLSKISLQKLKKDQLLIILLAGVLLIIIAWPSGNTSNSKKSAVPDDTSNQQTASEEESLNAYGEALEKRLQETLSKVDGVGKVEVMITLKSTSEKVIEKDTQSASNSTVETDSEGGQRETKESSSNKTSIYAEDENGVQSPYVVKELEPEIEGVVVIAEGGGNAVTAQNISEAVMALFSVSAHRIKVMKLN